MINFDTMQKLVKNKVENVKVKNVNLINRVKKLFVIHNVEQEKTFRVVYEKRKVLPNLNTIPWGYKP